MVCILRVFVCVCVCAFVAEILLQVKHGQIENKQKQNKKVNVFT